jgi:predicted porin
MKKHLIAAGVVAAFAAPAMAQNVTVYGNIEMGPVSADSGTASTTYIANGVVNSSRLGFKGSEDLGGGLKAFFRLESGLKPETGSLGGSKSTSIIAGNGNTTTVSVGSANFFDRGAEVGLSGAFGTVKIGKFDMPNEGGEISHFGNVGLAATSGIFDNDIEIGSDVAGAYAYTTPTFNGVAFTIAGTFKNQDAAQMSDVTTDDLTSYGLSGTVSGVQFNLATGTKSVAGGVDTRQSVASVGYAFGNLKVSLTQIDNNMGSAADKKLTIATAAMPIGAGLTAHAMMRKFKIDGDADTQSGYAIGVSKGLSKRTTAYAAYMGANATSTGSAIDKATKPSQAYIGVNHSF